MLPNTFLNAQEDVFNSAWIKFGVYSGIATRFTLYLILPNRITENVDYTSEVNELDSVNMDKFYLYIIQLTAVELLFIEMMQKPSHDTIEQFAPNPTLSV